MSYKATLGMCALTLAVAAWADTAGAVPVSVFEDNFENTAVVPGIPTSPQVGTWPNVAPWIPEGIVQEAGGTNPPAPVTGTKILKTLGRQRTYGQFTSTLAGEGTIRMEADLRLDASSDYSFGLVGDAGSATLDSLPATIWLNLRVDGIYVYDDAAWNKVTELSYTVAEWQHYTLEYTLGSNQFTLTAGANQAVSERLNGVTSATAFTHGFILGGTTSTTGYADNFKVTYDGTLTAIDSTWKLDNNGTWSASANWTAGVPNGIDHVVNFGTYTTVARTVAVDGPRTLGTINLASPVSLTLGGTGSITLDVSSGLPAINVTAGTHTINTSIVLNKDTVITTDASTALTFGGNVAAAGKTLTKSGSGAAQFQRIVAGGLHIAEGTVTISSKASPMTPTGTSVVGSLSIAAGSALDLTNNALVVDYTGTSVLADVQGAIASGQLTSSQAGENRVMASGEASDLFAEPTGTFAGVTVDSSSVVAALTVSGDASLDGVVDSADFNLFVANYGLLSGARWTQADFDVDGKVTTLDFNALAGNFAAAVPGDGLLGSVVPEPASVAVLLAGLLLRRRRV